MKRKISAIMCADVVGYSRLVAEDEEEALRRLMSYRKVFQTFIEDAGGRIFNTAGDAILAEFPSAVDAVRAAIDIQESLRTRNTAYPKSRQMPFRIGLTIGDVVEEDGDLLGDAVNIAARLQTLSQPGGICLSHAVREQVANKLSAHFRDLGPQSVKNIPQEIHAFTVEFGQANAEPAAPGPAPVRRKAPAYAPLVAVALVALAAGAGLYWVLGRQPAELVAEPPPAVAAVQPSEAAVPATVPAAGTPAGSVPAASRQAVSEPPPPAPAATQQTAVATPRTAAPPPAEQAPSGDREAPAPAAAAPAGDAPDAGTDPVPDRLALQTDAGQAAPPADPPGGGGAVLPPARPQPVYSSEPMTGRRYSSSLVPFVCESCRARMSAQYDGGDTHKAIAVNTLGDVGWAWGWNTEDGARNSALDQCKGRNGKDCEVFAVNSTIVWEHPAPVVPNRPWVRPGEESAPFDAAGVRGISETTRKSLAEKYGPALAPKALAVGPGGEWSYFTKADSDEDAMRQALEVCSHFAGDICTIAALNDSLVNGGGAVTARNDQ